jgi:hypothetical protein
VPQVRLSHIVGKSNSRKSRSEAEDVCCAESATGELSPAHLPKRAVYSGVRSQMYVATFFSEFRLMDLTLNPDSHARRATGCTSWRPYIAQ